MLLIFIGIVSALFLSWIWLCEGFVTKQTFIKRTNKLRKKTAYTIGFSVHENEHHYIVTYGMTMNPSIIAHFSKETHELIQFSLENKMKKLYHREAKLKPRVSFLLVHMQKVILRDVRRMDQEQKQIDLLSVDEWLDKLNEANENKDKKEAKRIIKTLKMKVGRAHVRTSH